MLVQKLVKGSTAHSVLFEGCRMFPVVFYYSCIVCFCLNVCCSYCYVWSLTRVDTAGD